MDYPTYPGTDRTMKLGDHVTISDGSDAIDGRIVTLTIANGELSLAVQTGADAIEWCEPAELTYREVPLTVELPASLVEQALDQVGELDGEDRQYWHVYAHITAQLVALIREAQADD